MGSGLGLGLELGLGLGSRVRVRLRVGLGDADLHVEIDGPDVDALRVVGEDAVEDGAPALGRAVTELELRKLGDELHVLCLLGVGVGLELGLGVEWG